MHIHKCINIHICAKPAASVFADVYVGVKTHLCSVHTCPCTSVQNTCSKVNATLTAKNAHIYIPTPICIRIHMYTNTHAHPLHHPHAEALILRLTIYAQICIHKHIHMCINAHIYIYIHKCTYTYIYTHTHIYTRAYKLYIWTHAKHVWNDSAAAIAQDAKKLCPSPCPLQSGGGTLRGSSPIARPRGTTDKRRTTTTNSSSSHHHNSAPSRPHLLICTGVEQIHPVHGPPKLPAWPWPPETRSFSCHFGGFFQ